MKCPTCEIHITDAQVAMTFRPLSGSQDWEEMPVIAGVCTKCGWMEFHIATPRQFAEWVRSQAH